MTLELFLFPPSPRAFKVIAVAHHLRLSYETRVDQLFEGEQNHPDYVALNPNRRMPVLREDDFVLWESNAITQYLASKNPATGLLPDNARELAHVNQWQCWELAHWLPAVAVFVEENVKKAFRGEQPNPAELRKGETLFHTCAELLDNHLKEQDFVACGRMTVADFSVGSWLEGAALAKYPLEPYSAIKRWHQSLEALPAWLYARAQSDAFLQAMGARRGQ